MQAAMKQDIISAPCLRAIVIKLTMPPHALAPGSMLVRRTVQSTKEPYRQVHGANWQWTERKKQGDRARTTRDETVRSAVMSF